MQISELTEEELALVQRHRDEKANALERENFKSKAIATAYAFDLWSNESRQGLSFSTFTNTFGYQESDGRKMFEAIQRIFDAVLPAK